MKFYVAGKFEDKERVRSMIWQLRKLGWHCTFDWTYGPDTNVEEELRDIAIWETNAAKEADVLVLLAHPNGRGSYFEAGCAVAAGKEVWMVPYDARQRPTAPLYHPSVREFYTDEELVNAAFQDSRTKIAELR